MWKAGLILFFSCELFAQKTPQAARTAPPKVDTALRRRVAQFFQDQIEGKFRNAEPLVAKDSKDIYISSNKPRYTGFQIQNIEYSEDFKKATVIVRVERMVTVPGFVGHPVPGGVPSHWKIEKGKWCWYVDPSELTSSPFGPVRLPAGGMNAPTGAMAAPPGAPAPNMALPGSATIPAASTITPALIMVKADKTSLELNSGVSSSGQVTITNIAKTSAKLMLADPHVPGIFVKLDRTEVPPGGKAVVSVQSDGSNKALPQEFAVNVRVWQTQQLVPIKVSFARPAN